MSNAFDALVGRISPGGRLVRRRRLPGGLTCRMDVLDVERADGSRWKVSLRRFVEHVHDPPTAEKVAREFDVLRIMERAGVAAPRPIWLDAEGGVLGVPAIVQTYLPGRPLIGARHVKGWLSGLAEALAAIHRVTPSREERSWLRVQSREAILARVSKRRAEAKGKSLGLEILSAVETRLPTVEMLHTTLIHDDYWPGNVVWYRRKVAGVVDWSEAKLGDPRSDVACCRVDLVFTGGTELADEFRAEYERASGGRLKDQWCFDLFRGLEAWLWHKGWIKGYHDLGVRDLTAADVSRRLRVFLERALGEAQG